MVSEGEHSGAVVRGDPGCCDPSALLVHELGDGSRVQHRADKEQLGASAFVLPLDAVAMKVRSNAAIRDFEDSEVCGWHAPWDGENRRAADCQICDDRSETMEQPSNGEIIQSSSTGSDKSATSP